MQRKIYLLCCKEDYQFVWDNMDALKKQLTINDEHFELLVPYNFMQHDTISEKINALTMDIFTQHNYLLLNDKHMSFLAYEAAKDLAWENWYKEKLKHAKNCITMASEVAIINSHSMIDEQDLNEIQAELFFNRKNRKPLAIIDKSILEAKQKKYTN